MNIKKSQLKEFIKNIVRERLNEDNKIPLGNLSKLNPNIVKKADKGKLKLPSKNPFAQKVKKHLKEAGYKIIPDTSAQVQKDNQALKVQTEPKVNEASYKVVDPHAYEDQKLDKARTIQTDPKVNETAYKTQGPSYKTFEDSPQLPDAVNDPENA